MQKFYDNLHIRVDVHEELGAHSQGCGTSSCDVSIIVSA